MTAPRSTPTPTSTPTPAPTDAAALLERVGLIEKLPLEERAAAFAEAHDALQHTLGSGEPVRQHG